MLGQVWLNRHSIFSPDRPGDESIPARSTRHMWARHVAAERAPSLRLNWFIPWGDGQMELTFHPRGWGGGGGGVGWQTATYSEGERQLPIGLAWRVQVDILPLPALVIRALALREKRRDTNRGVKRQRGATGAFAKGCSRRQSVSVWPRSASVWPPGGTVVVKVLTGKNMQCNMLHWDSFKTNNQTADSLWAVIMTTRCHWANESPDFHMSNTEHQKQPTYICWDESDLFFFLFFNSPASSIRPVSEAHRWGVERVSERRLRGKTDSHRAHWASQGTAGPAPAAIQNGGIGQGNLVQALRLVEKSESRKGGKVKKKGRDWEIRAKKADRNRTIGGMEDGGRRRRRRRRVHLILKHLH